MISDSTKNGCRKKVACRDLDIDLKTICRWETNLLDKREGPRTTPQNKLSVKEREEIIKVATSEEFQDLTPWKIVPKLADRGVYLASESTFYRVLKENKLLAHRGKSKPKTHNRPAPLVAKSPNEIWSWDITFLKGPVRGSFFYLYLFMDIFSRKIVGFEVYESESMENSSQLITKICQKENINKDQLILHADNGGAMKGSTMLSTLQWLGVCPSFSRPKVSNDNPFSESLFKTLKYCPEFPSRPFESIEAARDWVGNFVVWYNTVHLHSGIKFVTPMEKHTGLDLEILRNRKNVYENAKGKNSNRWSRETRNWEPIKMVYLNHLQKRLAEVAIRSVS